MDHHGMYTKGMENKNVFEIPVSAEELKIRSELGMKIERDLEEEIKESIYNLAIRLHRIIQHRKERDTKEEACDKVHKKTRAISEVIISMRIGGGTKIEIKEVNKEANERECSFRPKKCLKEVKKIDWEKNLRVGSSPVSVKGSCVRSMHKDRIRPRGKYASGDKKLVQLVWKV